MRAFENITAQNSGNIRSHEEGRSVAEIIMSSLEWIVLRMITSILYVLFVYKKVQSNKTCYGIFEN